MANAVTGRFRFDLSQSISSSDSKSFAEASLANFEFFVRFSTRETELFFVQGILGERVIGAVPVVKLRKRKVTDQLRPELKKWLAWFGPLARKTTLLVDTSFLAYDYASPFFCSPEIDCEQFKREASQFLKSLKPDSVWIAEPTSQSAWGQEQGYDTFQTLPMVHVELGGATTMERYVAAQSKKRRRNYRADRDEFARAGAGTVLWESPFTEEQGKALHDCLMQSASRSAFHVPYNDVLTDESAFRAQPQTALVARVGKNVIGFMTFIRQRGSLLQSHGGLDYRASLVAKAYHNLMYDSIAFAINEGLERVSFGPLNNETKRRVGTHLRPVSALLWNRNPIDRFVARKLFIPNLSVFRGRSDKNVA